MSFDPVNSSYGGLRNISHAQKRDLLWNILQPGDPYDIKKSMIAKLPGDRKLFMGDQLQMVCLFQAAQIQRLIENLDEYKLKYKEIERRELDRHSYQIQIKELAEKLGETDTIRNQNMRLKEFIRRLNSELEELKGGAVRNESLQRKYETALTQIESTMQQNHTLKIQISSLKSTINTQRTRFEASDRARITEIEQLRRQMEIKNRSQIDLEIRRIQDMFRNEKTQLDSQIRRLRELLDTKNRETEDLRAKITMLESRLAESNTYSDEMSKLRAKIMDYENKLAMASLQIERLGKQLSNKDSQLAQFKNRYQMNDQQINRKQTALRQALRKSGMLQQQVDRLKRELQSKPTLDPSIQINMVKMSEQIERLNAVLATTVNQKLELNTRLSRLEYDYQNARNAGAGDMIVLERQYKSQIATLTQEVERLTSEKSILQSKITTIENSKIVTNNADTDRLQRSMRDQQGTITRLNGQIAELKRRIEDYIEEIRRLKMQGSNITPGGSDGRLIAQLQTRNQSLAQDNRRLQDMLRLAEQNVQVQPDLHSQRRVLELQATIQHLNDQIDRLQRAPQPSFPQGNSTQRQIISTLNIQIQQLKRKNAELLARSTRKDQIPQHITNQIRQLQEQVRQRREQYNKVLYEKDELNRMAHQLQQRLQEGGNTTQALAEAQNKIARLNDQIDRLNRKLSERLSDSNRNLNGEIERLNGQLHRTNVQLNEHRLKWQQATDQNARLNRLLSETKQQIDIQINSQTTIIQEKVNSLNQQNQQYRRRITQLQRKNNQLEGTVRTLQGTVRTLEAQNRTPVLNQEVDRLTITVRTLTHDKEDLQRRVNQLQNSNRRLNELQSRILTLTQQNQRLSQASDQKSRELNMVNQRLREIEGIKGNVTVLQERLNTLLNQNNSLVEELRVAKEGLRNASEQLRRYSMENEQLRSKVSQMEGMTSRRISEYELRITQITQNYERLKLQQQSTGDMQNRLMLAARENQTLISDIQRLKQNISQASSRHQGDIQGATIAINNLKSQNEDLKRKIAEYTEIYRRYTELESRYGILNQQKQRLTSQFQQRNRQVTVLNQKLVDLESLNRNIRDLQDKLQRAITEKNSYADQYNHLQENTRRISQEYNELKQKVPLVSQENDQLRRRVAELQAGIREAANLQNRVAEMSMEIQRLNNVLRQKLDEQGQISRQLTEYRTKLPQLVQQNRTLRNSINEVSQRYQTQFQSRVTVYQQKLTTATNQNSQLKRRIQQLQFSIRQYSGYETTIMQLRQQNQQLQRTMKDQIEAIIRQSNLKIQQSNQDNDTLKRRIQQLEINLRRISEYQSAIQQLQQQNQQLQRTRKDEIEAIIRQSNLKIQQANQDNDALKRRILQIENEYRGNENKIGTLSTEITRLNQVLHTQLAQKQQLQARAQQILMELNEIQRRYQQAVSQNQTLKRSLQDISVNLENQLRSRIRSYEDKENTYRRQIEELRRKVAEGDNANRRLAEYERQRVMMNEQMEQLQRRFSEMMNQAKMSQTEWQTRYRQLEIAYQESQVNLNRLRQQNEHLKMNSMQNQGLQNKIKMLIEQIERLNSALRIKVQESQQWQQKYNQTIMKFNTIGNEFERLQNSNTQLARECEMLRQRIREYEEKFPRLNTEFERLNQIINSQKEEIYRLQTQLSNRNNLQVLQEKNRHLAQQIRRLQAVIEQLNTDIAQLRIRFTDQTALHKRIQQHLALFVVLFAEIESLRKRVKDKQKQVEDVRRSSLAPFVI